MKYCEVDFKIFPDIQVARDIVAALAGECGFESFEDTKEGLKGYIQAEAFEEDQLAYTMATFPIPDVKVEYTVNDVEEKDWNATWEETGFDPIVVNDSCVIYDAKKGLAPIHEQLEKIQSPLLIGIEARQAFGTGTHSTTQMIVSTLLNMDLKGKRVLDCGCGTGILSIVAAKQGAAEVVGYDIDNWSVENTQHNAALNQVTIEVLEGDKSVLSHVNGIFDVVLANINRNILLADMSSFLEVLAQDGTLIISGFYEMDAPILEQHAKNLGLQLYQTLDSEDWCCLVLRRLCEPEL